MAFSLLQQVIDDYVEYLAKRGYEMIVEAQYKKQVGNKSYNQRDAFGALVYYNGELKKFVTIGPMIAEAQHVGWEAKGIKSDFGRNWLAEFASTYDKVPKKGFALIIVNAAFYTKIHEEKLKYKVISQEYSRMEALATELGGTVKMI